MNFFIVFLLSLLSSGLCCTTLISDTKKDIEGVSISQFLKVKINDHYTDSMKDKVIVYKYENNVIFNHFYDYTLLDSGKQKKLLLQNYLVTSDNKPYGFLYKQHPSSNFDANEKYVKEFVIVDSILKVQWYNNIVIDVPVSEKRLKTKQYNLSKDSLHNVYDISKVSGDTTANGTLSFLYVKGLQLPFDYSIQKKYENQKNMILSEVKLHLITSVNNNQTTEIFFDITLIPVICKDTDVLLNFIKLSNFKAQ